MAKPVKPLTQQIEEYKFQFELAKEWNDFLKTNKTPDEIRTENNDTSNPSKEYWDDWTNYHHVRTLKKQALFKKGWLDKNWNWDESWDGQLIKDVQALEAAGFTIVSFSRKRKVTLKSMPEYSRSYIVEKIGLAVDDSWYSISFKPTLSIYWKGRSHSWHY